MLISSDLTQTPTVQKLVQIWVGRYQPQVALSTQHSTNLGTLAHVASPEGKCETIAKLHRALIKLNCEFAATQARELHEHAPSTTSLSETKHIVQCAVEIYSNLLAFYEQSSPASADTLQASQGNREPLSVGLSASDLIELSSLLEPLLLEYQDRHQITEDWATVGFLTTYLNFSNVALLNNLNIGERIFVKPYFKFLEEQVALPWQRVCAAASSHDFSSPAFQSVNYILLSTEDIAHRVYMKLVRQFPKLTMRRGRLDHPGVRHSCIRDLNMFQAYLCICILQGSLAPVEDELVRLCAMVMPRVGVPWEMTVQWNELLMAEVLDRALLSHQALLKPYVTGFIGAFQQSQSQFV